MRFSTSAVVAAVAIGAQAVPQSVAPIVQISDGQIQAPGTSYAVSAPSATAVLPSVTPVPLPSVVPSSAAVPVPSSAPAPKPSVPAGSGAASAPYPVSSGAVYTNGTVLPTGAPTSKPAAGSSTGSPQPTAAPGSGAGTAFVSMGALFAGLFAFLA